MVETDLIEGATDTGSEISTEDNLENMSWYVVQAYSGFEKQVQVSLRTYIERSDLKGQFGQVLVPTEDVV